MSSLTDLKDWTRPLEGIKYQTTREATWEVAFKGSAWWVVVPPGFRFDISVPRGLRWIISPHDPRYHPAACLHDYLLVSGWDRVRAAAEFHLALQATGIPRLPRLALFLAVAVYKWN